MKGIGTDIVSIARIQTSFERQGDRFVNRILTNKEQEIFRQRNNSMSFLANRFAGKEALAKALGTGIAKGVSFTDMEILVNSQGGPVVTLTGFAHEQLLNLGATHAQVSLSDERDYAVAFAVIS